MSGEIIELAIGLVSQLSKMVYKYVKKRRKKRGKNAQEKSYSELSKEEKVELVDTVIDGVIGDKLVQAYKLYTLKGDRSLLDEIRREEKKSIVFVVEVSRSIASDVAIITKREPEYIFNMVKDIHPKDIPTIAVNIYNMIKIINAIHRGPRIKIFLSTPSTLAFQIGQLVGLDKFNIELYQYTQGKYIKVPTISRNLLQA